MKVQLLKSIPVVLIVLVLMIVGPALLPSIEDSLREHNATFTTIGDPAAFQVSYENWKNNRSRRGNQDELVLPLHYSKGLSAKVTTARGLAKLDLKSGVFSATITGLPDTSKYDVWLVDNRPGPETSVKPEASDRMIRLGTLQGSGDSRRLVMSLDTDKMRGFEVDLVVITPGAQRPGQADLLVGSPTLFQRMFFHEGTRGSLADLLPEVTDQEGVPAFAGLVPAPAVAHASTQTDAMARLVAKGEDLFFNETFAGNGRTCGTCHPADNNLTIDPAFIAKLPPKNPLFVAEFIDALNFEKNGGKRFEDPLLMRKFGLIVENLDGFGDLANRFTMRGVPHTLGLARSLNPGQVDVPNDVKVQRTGWSGDGAPGDGSLRQFAVGAVTQHFPRTTNRVPRSAGVLNPDFRLPTERELDAMEAFQLSLGRLDELDLAAMKLKGTVPELGRRIFLQTEPGGPVAAGQCQRCHANAGANVNFFGNPADPSTLRNFNFNTGVEALPNQPARQVRRFPFDGGFGTTTTGTFEKLEANDDGSFGNGTFNTPSIIEAADTPPFFHNNSISTIEEAVGFYNSDAFNQTGAAIGFGGIDLEPTQVEAVAAMLRVINAVENIRASVVLDERALRVLAGHADANVKRLLVQSRAEVTDGMQVLSQAGLHPEAVRHLERARTLLGKALSTAQNHELVDLIRRAVHHQKAARADLVRAG